MSKNGKIFTSKTDPIPRIRPELDIIPVENNGNSLLYFHDALGYAPQNFALDREVGPLLSMLDGQKSIAELEPYLGDGVTTDQLLNYVQFLDENRLLLSKHFQQYAKDLEDQYESAPVHHSITAGNSCPADPGELRSFLDEAFSKHETPDLDIDESSIKALYAPHIDPRVGMASYVKAFSSIRDLKPSRVVVLATSHYAGMYPDLYDNKPFIVSRKNFEMPLGTIPADLEAIETLLDQPEEMGISSSDRAHRIEHSIELHLMFLNYLWDHEFSIVPILIRGFDELFYMEDGHLGKQVEQFGNYLGKQYGDDEETLFLISGDLAHIGRKFGDDQPASDMFSEVKSFDKMFMNSARQADKQSLLNLMKEGQKPDPYRICGFAPLYSFLNALPDVEGEQISYDLWDETERESAVSFGSILYSK